MVEEMVALAMVVSPRGLAAVTEYRRLAMSRVLGSTMPIVLLQRGAGSGGRSRVAPLPASSRRGFSCHAALPRGPSSGSLSQGGPWKGHSEKSYMRAAALEEPPELTKKRLSRDERTALVKSYVSKFMSENNGEFPSLTAVLKDTGGSRAVVKDILADIQSSLDPADNKSGIAAPVSEAVTQGKNEQSGENAGQEKLKSPAAAAAAVSESEEEESADETEEEEEASAEEQQQQQKAEAKPAESERVTGMRRMVGETPGEIKTYSNILSRLRSLGTADSSSTSSPSSHQVFNEPLPEPDDKDSVKKTSFAARILPPRHGMFVRFLHPAATEDDLRNAFGDCGEITRVSAVKPMKPTAKFTYGFIDFKTADGLSNALRKNVEIRGHKVEMEAAPTQNTQIPDTVSKAKDQPQSSSGAGLIDNLVSKVVSMAPPDNGNNPQAPPRQLWNGQEAGRFNQFPNKAKGGMGFQRMDLPPRNESMQQQQPPKMDLPPPRNEMPPPQMQQQQQIRMGMPPPPRNDNNMPYRQLPPRTENGGYASPIPPLSDPQKLRKDLAVCLENLPPSTNVSQLKDALGIHGEIYATYMKNRDASGSSYYFEYLCEEGKDNALAAHWVHLNGQMLRISRADLPKTTVVRVSNISPSTPDSEFINACKSCGQVERVESRRDRVRDVFYHPAEGRNIAKILDRLNEITLNQSRWQAKPAPRCTLNMLNKPEGQEFICQQIKALLKNQESMLQQLQIEQRDLRELSMYAVEALTSHLRKPSA